MFRSISILAFVVLAACNNEPAAPAAASVAAPKPAAKQAEYVAPATPKSDAEKTVLDVALGSPDHSTLVAAVKATDLAPALGSPGGIYTVFAPTNEAFAKLPPGTLDTLLKPENKAQLKAIVQHHACVPILDLATLKDGQKIGMSDGTSVTAHVTGDKVKIDDANVVGTVHAMNGVVYVVDAVILPPSK